jgi:ribosomal protein S18 acetylase RimI-like enzyme
MRIRRATTTDAEILADFNCRLAFETEGKSLSSERVISGVTRGLTVGDEVTYFVAESEERVVGQLMLTREWSDWRDGWMYWLQSVYVHADFRGQGVFRQLLEHVRQQLKQRGDVACLRLYVEEENQPAIETYTRLGFKDPGYRVMELPIA